MSSCQRKSAFDRMLRATIDYFGVPVRYIRDGAEHAIKGVFDANSEQVIIGSEGPEIDSLGPQLGINKNDLPFTPQRGDRVVLAETGRTFTVYRQKPDSEHGIRLFLHEADGDGP